MKHSRRLWTGLALGLLLTAAVTAQGPSSASIAPYGQACAAFGRPAELRAVYNPSEGLLTLRQDSWTPCCDTYLAGQVLIIGNSPITPGLVLPGLFPGCTVDATPEVTMGQAPTPTGRWEARISPIFWIIDCYLQTINHYYTPSTQTHEFQSTNALRITFSP
ncbi:MAG: hypothetical protein AAF628_31235 [Planctomycetota bacterium]